MKMQPRVRRKLWILAAIAVAVMSGEVVNRAPAVAASALLHPWRRPLLRPTPDNCEEDRFSGAGVILHGWRCSSGHSPRGTVIYLHGVADNRGSGSTVIRRYVQRGFDVIAFDGRAHGKSEGSTCTYGYFEKQDLVELIDSIERGPIILIGNSLGAAVAIQAAPLSSRIAGVVAVETFSDLRTIATERAARFLAADMIAVAFRLAEQSGRFEVDAVSPERAAAAIRVPVLLIHGTADRGTPPTHSQRVMAALAGPKRLILVDGAGHNESLRHEDVWAQIDTWIEQTITIAPS